MGQFVECPNLKCSRKLRVADAKALVGAVLRCPKCGGRLVLEMSGTALAAVSAPIKRQAAPEIPLNNASPQPPAANDEKESPSIWAQVSENFPYYSQILQKRARCTQLGLQAEELRQQNFLASKKAGFFERIGLDAKGDLKVLSLRAESWKLKTQLLLLFIVQIVALAFYVTTAVGVVAIVGVMLVGPGAPSNQRSNPSTGNEVVYENRRDEMAPTWDPRFPPPGFAAGYAPGFGPLDAGRANSWSQDEFRYQPNLPGLSESAKNAHANAIQRNSTYVNPYVRADGTPVSGYYRQDNQTGVRSIAEAAALTGLAALADYLGQKWAHDHRRNENQRRHID